MLNLTIAGTLHTVLVAAGLAFGLAQFVRFKGGPIHRAIGYAFVYAMLVGDGAALAVFQFTGKFNFLHVGAIANLMCIVMGIWPLLRTPRQPDWRSKHYIWICWSYVGLIAAAATELLVRNIGFGDRIYIWTATIAASAAVTASGFVLIRRYSASLAGKNA